MIIQKEFLNQLRAFGLNSYESKIWTALLSKGVSTAGELSDIADVPRSRSYDVLESLEKKGFVIMKFSKPIKFIAVPPEEVLKRVKKSIVEEAEKQTNFLDKLKSSELLQELKTLHKEGIEIIEPFELSGSVKGRKNIYNKLEEMVKNAQKSIVIKTTAQGFIRKSEALKNALKKAEQRGVDIKIAAPINKENKQAVANLKGIAQVRNSGAKARFMIVDEKELVFMVLDDLEVHPTYDLGIWVNAPFFVSALNSLFNLGWDTMKTVK